MLFRSQERKGGHRTRPRLAAAGTRPHRPDQSATLFRRKYYQNGAHAGYIMYVTDAAQAVVKAQELSTTALYKVAEIPSGMPLDIALSTGSLIRITLANPINVATVIGVSDIPSGTARRVTLILNQGTGNRVVNWPANIQWLDGTEPVLKQGANQFDVIILVMISGDTKIYGSHAKSL